MERYVAGDPVEDIAAAHGITRPAVRRIAARAGIPPRSGWQRRFPIDESAFDNPSPIGWWLIGLLAADGSIHEAEHRVSLCQTLDDADVLHAFYAYVGCPNRPITLLGLSDEARERQWNRRPAAEARIFSRRIVDALGRHGIVPRKAATMELSDAAAREPAVWLGILDGDGTLGLWGTPPTPQIAFAGSKALIHQCARFWRDVLDLPGPGPSPRHHRGQTWTLGLAPSRAVRAARLLLDASPVSHRRKRALLEEIAAWMPQRPLRANIQSTIV